MGAAEPSLDALLPVLYLRGISTGDFQEALAGLLGKDAPNLSPSVIGRLTAAWEADYAAWHSVTCRPAAMSTSGPMGSTSRPAWRIAECMLVLIGATPEGQKELVGFQVGMRESAQSWRELLVDLKARLDAAPEIAVGDGALGFWKALEEVFPSTRHQRCWVHKTVNVLNKVPNSMARDQDGPERNHPAPTGRRPSARSTPSAEIRGEVREGRRLPGQGPRRAAAFYDFPAEHWDHLRTSNPIESVFATVRHRTVRTKGALSQHTARLMVFKLTMAASKTWRRLKGESQLPKVIRGVTFCDGVEVTKTPDQRAA